MGDDPSVLLIVDDELQIRRAVANALRPLFDVVIEAATGSDAIDQAASRRPDLIVLDLGLPDVSGIAACTEIRRWSQVPVIVLSARHSADEKAILLDAGADDYMTKPFSTVELQARARAMLRRSQSRDQAQTRVEIGELVIDLSGRTIKRSGESIHLTPTEWDLLRVLVASADKTLTHRHLFSSVWGRSPGDPQQYLRVYVANLRRKIEADPLRPRLIITEPGVGYRFERPSTA